jgi:hypothetical protein
MNENNENFEKINDALRQIFEDPALHEEFKQSENLDEMYKLAISLSGGYSIEEFENYIFNMLRYAQETIDGNAISEEELSVILGAGNDSGNSIPESLNWRKLTSTIPYICRQPEEFVKMAKKFSEKN